MGVGGGVGLEGENRNKLKFRGKVCYYIFYFVLERYTPENEDAESVTVSRRVKTPSANRHKTFFCGGSNIHCIVRISKFTKPRG